MHCNRYKGIKDLSELVVDFVENASVLNPGFKLHDSGFGDTIPNSGGVPDARPGMGGPRQCDARLAEDRPFSS